MSDFKEIQANLKQALQTRDQSYQSIFLLKEKLKKLDKEKKKILRHSDEESNAYGRIIREERELKAQISKRESALNNQVIQASEYFTAFESFSDPRKHIQNFSDQYPIMLFPVRLETRFKKWNTSNGLRHQLWVRVMPDDCSIDTFEEVLSESEILKARNFWLTVWSAGTSDEEEIKTLIEDKKKAAWKGLANNIQAGRASWIKQNYQPVNQDDIPKRESTEEALLIIPVDKLPGEDESTALQNYWCDMWLAKGDPDLIEEALNKFNRSIGDENTDAELLKTYIPFNYNDPDNSSEKRTACKTVFIQFPALKDTDTKLSSWSQPAKITTLPERFVLLGFKGIDSNGNPNLVLNEIGAQIPDTLIIGPNPSLDTDVVLKKVLIEGYMTLTSEGEKRKKLEEFYDKLKEPVREEKNEEEFINEILTLPEENVPSELGKIFDNFRDEVKAVSYIEYLSQKSETKWLYNFDEAVNIGMGFKVDLSPSVYNNGFDKLYVLGLKMRSDEVTGKTDLEKWIRKHHYGMNGFSIMPQGSPTNNTEDTESAYSENEDSEDTYERYMTEKSDADDPDDFFDKKDGKWLATLLGIDPDLSSLRTVENYYHSDQCESKAMNTVLWNATMGYFMENMLTPVFNDTDERIVRDFFIHFVSGRGNIPAIRIGNQPYGILITSTVQHLNWLNQRIPFNKGTYMNMLSGLRGIYNLCMKIYNDWKRFLENVAYVGKEGDPHQILLDAIGLHASSVEFYQRYAESFAHLFNRLNLTGLAGAFIKILIEGGYKQRGMDLLKELGYTPKDESEVVPILEKFFFTNANKLKGDVIDDRPLSEINPVRPYTKPDDEESVGKNYIEWLIENALIDHEKIKKQKGFEDGAPKALLYQMLRHAVELEFSNTAFNLYLEAEILNRDQIKIAKVDQNFIGIQEKVYQPTKYEFLDRKEPRITNDQEITIAKHISNLVASSADTVNTRYLTMMVDALKKLKDTPTARLERAFIEHIDCCSYRLDAWLLGFVNYQLYGMRYPLPGEQKNLSRPGTYIGAYGWLLDLKPDDEILTPVQLNEELNAIFNPNNDLEIVKDNNNAGYIHAPSINQAVTASVLRNAYISNASKQDPELYKINLSSERVRMALSIIEGIQHGQSLGALLGYQLERGLHDRYEEAEVDFLIYELRKAFSLVSNRLKETSKKEEDLESVSQIEARNVVDGYALVKHVKKTGNKHYPFGKTGLAPANSSQKKIIDSEVERLLNITDAVADLATAEGIHQAVQANYERAAGNLDTYSKGSFPQVPDVIKTPRSGISLTNRVAIHLETGITLPSTAAPRVIAEPAIDKFLSDILPLISDIACKVVYKIPSYEEGVTNPEQTTTLTFDNLGLRITDLFYLLDIDSDKSLTALDDYILKWLHETENPRPDIELEIKYSQQIPGKISLFEVAQLIKNLRSLILASRPLKSSDLRLSNEASDQDDVSSSIDMNRINNAFTRFKNHFSDLNNLNSGMDITNHSFISLIDDEDFEKTLVNKQSIINGIDDYLDLFVSRLYGINQFSISQAGFGFIYDRKASIYASIYKKVLDHKKRWLEKQTTYDDLINTQLPAATTEEDQIEILQKAERVISTSYTIPLPVPPVVTNFMSILSGKKASFDAKLNEIETWLNSSFILISDLYQSLQVLKTGVGSVTGKAIDEFDLLNIETEDDEKQILVFAEDLKVQAVKLNAALLAKVNKIEQLINPTPAEGEEIRSETDRLTEAAKELFGEEFKIVPVFNLSTEHGNEIQKVIENKDQLLSYQKNEKNVDFPVDDWLYSVARVREKMEHWENMCILSEAFKNIELELTPIQLPYLKDDHWLGLSYPENYSIDSDKLLYTAYIKSFNPNIAQCGLLIDEWNEVIPTEKETTGLSFQYDQPNAEPPQSILMVTPSEFTGHWSWENLVQTLHETLDMARLRAMEPAQIDQNAFAQFLPATVSTVTVYPMLTMALNFAVVNGLELQLNTNENG